MTDPFQLRASFNAAACEYDAIRPGYPEALIEDIIRLSQIPAGGSIVEVGCGTGQATLPFARRGYELYCLDIGPDLLAIAREKLRQYPARFELAAFEDWPPPPGGFDLLISATAFHWVPRPVRYQLAARALKPGGSLAVFSNEHPRTSGGFFEESQTVYRRVVQEWFAPGISRPERPLTQEAIAAAAAEMSESGLFAPAVTRTYPWRRVYSTSDYLRLLDTYSDHRLLPAAQREELYRALADLIDHRFGGQVEKDYLAILYLVRKAAGEGGSHGLALA